MKTENLTINDCKATIWHSTNLALDSLHIDIKCQELSQIQRLIAICGGELTVFSATYEFDANTEKIFWVKWSSYGNVVLNAMCHISEISYKLLIAGFGGNNCVRFLTPVVMTMVDDNYFILPEDKSLYRSDYNKVRSTEDQTRN